MTPWPFQEVAISELRAHMVPPFEPGLLQAPTGSGKSEMMGHVARLCLAKHEDNRVGFVVNRRILVKDLCKRVSRLGLDYGVIMSGVSPAPWKRVQVASFDTLWRRPHLPKLSLVFIDEAHFSLSDRYVEVIRRFQEQGTAIIGTTATPIRGLGEGLGFIYKWMVRTPDVPDLIDQGFLVRPRVFAPTTVDLKKVKIVGDDYNQKQLAAACDRSAITGDILRHWQKNLRGKPTIAFGVSLEHCQHMRDLFVGANVRAEYIDHTSTNLDDVWRRLANYETEVVFNVGMCGYGFDLPEAAHMIEARPTASKALWLQHCGRVMRICSRIGKKEAVINDHAGNALRHGLPDEYRDWPLDCQPKKPSAIGEPSFSVYRCAHCGLVFKRGPVACSRCNTTVPVKYREVKVIDGELEELKKQQEKERKTLAIETWKSKLTPEQKMAKLDEWKKLARERGYSKVWPYATYTRTFGEPVPKVTAPPPPDIRRTLNEWENL